MVIGFDFDGVISEPLFRNFVKSISLKKDTEIVLITTREDVDSEVVEAVKELGIQSVIAYAIGSSWKTKAEFIAEEEMAIDIFFDNDPYEVDAMTNLGIFCLFVPPVDKDSLMAEIIEGFYREKSGVACFPDIE